jgi:hypothetical protein
VLHSRTCNSASYLQLLNKDNIHHTNTEDSNRKKLSLDCTYQEHFSFKQHNIILHSNIENGGPDGIRVTINSSSECSEFHPWSQLCADLSPHTETNTTMKNKNHWECEEYQAPLPRGCASPLVTTWQQSLQSLSWESKI